MKKSILTFIAIFTLGTTAIAAGTGGGFKAPTCETMASHNISAGDYEAATGVSYLTHFTKHAIDLYSSGVEVSKGTFITLENLKSQGVLGVRVLTDCPGEVSTDIFVELTRKSGSLLKRKKRQVSRAKASQILTDEMIVFHSSIGTVTNNFSGLSKVDLVLGGKNSNPEITIDIADRTFEL